MFGYRQTFVWFSYTRHFCLETCTMDLAAQKKGAFSFPFFHFRR